MTPEEFAELEGVSARTVQRWCDNGEVPGATRDRRGRWHLPGDAVRVVPLEDPPADDGGAAAMAPSRRDVAVTSSAAAAALPAGQGLSLAVWLDSLPAFVTLAEAAQLLGIPEAAIRRNRDELGARPWGERGALMVPQAAVRRFAGLS